MISQLLRILFNISLSIHYDEDAVKDRWDFHAAESERKFCLIFALMSISFSREIFQGLLENLILILNMLHFY